MAELSIPVRLQIQNLQSLISDLQNKLSNLKVGSAGFKSVQNLIMSIKNEIDKLQIQTSKPFINENQFTKAENSVDKLEDELRRVEITLGRIKFSDLELNPQQKADLKAFEDQINAIKANLKTVKDTAKQDFLGSAMGKLWSEKFDETAITKSFSQITNNIRSEVLKQKDIVKEAQEAFNSYQNAMKANNSIEQFLKTKNPLEEANLGAEKYAQIFQNTKAGLRFRSGGSTILEEWLKTQLELDDATIKGLVEGSAQKVKAQLEERLKAIKLANSEVINKNVSAETDYTNESARLQQLNQIMQQLGFSEQSVAVANQALRAQLTDTTNAMAEYQDKAVQAARSNQDVKDTTNAMMSQLSSLRSTLQQTNAQFIQMQRTQQSFNQMKMAVVNFMGFNQVLNLTKNAIRSAINHIKELDTVMNNISIVTDMSTSDLWDQVDAYSKMAQTYGVSIQGAYEVSQIYYQQGLETADVLTLTNETLKLAKISGLDYATTTDYMTTALRGFKMEMSEASTVVDVYSNLAANTAVSQEELAVAMSRTASSMESVGATFEETSAMIGTMVAVTRESATNIGSAMKSIASRYGELTKDPTKLVDEEGEAMAFNKVDTALQSVGISMKTVDGQFREFTDVIVELGEKWDQLDSTQQRYIATQFAGNRQQSRFLALVSNVDLLKSNLDVAMNSEDTGTLQALKALDSIEAKTEQVRVAYQQFYTTIGAENVWKGFLDGAKNVINTLNSFPKLFGKIPVAAIASVASIITVIKNLGVRVISTTAEIFGSGILQGMISAQGQAQSGAEGLISVLLNTIKGKLGLAKETGKQLSQAVVQGTQEGIKQNTDNSKVILSDADQARFNSNQNAINTLQPITDNIAARAAAVQLLNQGSISLAQYGKIQQEGASAIQKVTSELQAQNQALEQNSKKIQQNTEKNQGFFTKYASQIGNSLQSFGSALNMVAMMIDTTREGGKSLSGTIMAIGGAATLAGIGVQALNGALKSIPWMAIVSGVFALINGISTLIVTPEERLEELNQKAEDLSNKAKEAKAEYRTLDNSIKKLDELKEKRYESAEAAEEYQTAVDELADKFPEMIAGFDDAGNIILDTTNAEHLLAEAREKSKQATYDAAQAEFDKAKAQRTAAQNALAGQQIASIKANNYDTNQSELIQDFLIKRLGIHEAEAGEIAMQSSLESKFQFLKRYNYTEGPAQFINLFDTLEQAKTYLDENFEQLSPLQKDFYNAFFGSTNSPEALINDYSKLQNEINQLLNDPNEQNRKNIQDKYAKLKAIYDEAFTKYNDNDLFDFETAANSLEAIGKLIDTWSGDTTNTKGYEKELISAWQQSGKANTIAWETLSKSGTAAAIVTKAIQTNLNGQDWDFDNATDEQKKTWFEYQQQMANFIGSLTTDELATFEKMMGDSANFTTQDFSDEFGYKLNDTVTTFLQTWFADGVKSINERLEADIKKTSGKDNLDELTGFYKDLNDIRNKIGEDITTTEENYFHTVLAAYKEFQDQGFTNSATNFGEVSLNLFKAINNLDGSIEKVIWQLISDNGINTIEGINSIIDSIKINENLNDTDKTSIETLLNTIKSTIIPNVNLSIQAATSELLENWSDISGELSKAMSDGLTLQEADKLISQAKALGVEINTSDFTTSGDKLILTADKFQTYWAALAASADTNASEWQGKINKALAYLSAVSRDELDIDNENVLTAIRAVIPNFDFSSYLDGTGRLSQEGYDKIKQAIQESQNGLNKFIWYNETAAKQLAQSWSWEQGNYFNSITDSNGEEVYQAVFNNIQELTEAIIQDQTSHFSKLGADADKRALLDNLYSSYDALISDVMSKGMENIHLDDYTGIIKDQKPEIEEALKSGDYQKFIEDYVQYAGKTLDETNDLIAQAIEKDNETVSVDLIKDLQFTSGSTFRASLSELKELTNKLDISLSNLIDNGIAVFDQATEEYIVDATKVENLDLSSSNFQNTIRESIKEFFSELASYITNAIKGSLSGADAQELQRFASIQGIGKLDFTETSEGLKVSETSAIKLYQAIKQIDSIQGQIVFKELSESLQENNENFQSVTSILSHISTIQKEISSADKNVSKARLEQYEAELSVAQEILAVRSTSEDSSFNFMSNDIPAAQNNPLNYYKNWSEAIKTLNTAMKTSSRDSSGKTHKGLINYQDYYNIITELNNLAGISGDIELAGVTLNGSMEAAAELIEKGAQALTTTDAGDIAVSLGDIGIDFKTGTGNMSEGIQEGIQELAQNQVEMLDSMISLLETIVAMEALGDLDVNDDMVISVPEIAVDTEVDESGLEWISEYSENYKTTIQKIIDNFPKDDDGQTILDQVTANGHTMTEILNAEAKDLREWNITAQDLSTLLTNFYKLSMSDEFDIDKPWESFIQIFEGMDWGNLTIGANAGKHQITLTDEGQYYIEYHSKAALDRIKAAMPEWKDKKDEEIQAEVEKIINQKNASKPLEARQNYLLRVLTGDIKVVTNDNGETTYTVGNQSYSSWEDAVAASDIFKLDSDQKIVVNEGKAWGTITLSGTIITIKSDGSGQVTYEYNGTSYTSKEQAYQAVYKDKTGQDATSTKEDGTAFTTQEYQNWKIQQGLTIVPAVSIDGKSVDLQNDPQTREKIAKFRDSTDDELTQLFSSSTPTSNGKYVITLDDGITVSFDEKDITTDGHIDTSKVRAVLAEQLGLDTALSSTIIESIGKAFDGDAGTKIGQTIGEGIRKAFAGEDGQLNEIEIPSITLKPLKINIDTSAAQAEGAVLNNIFGLNLDDLTAVITAFSTTKDPNELVNSLEAIVTNYTGEGNPNALVSTLAAVITSFKGDANPNDLVNALSAIITSYHNGGDPNSLTNALSALVTVYENGGDPDGLVNALAACVTTYTNEGVPDNLVNALHAIVASFKPGNDPNLLVKALSAVVTKYTNGGDPSSLVNALTAYIKEYNDQNAVKPTLDDLTQFISEIDTKGADAALAAWRAQQEANALKIKIVKSQQQFDQETDAENEFVERVSEMASNIYQLPEDVENPYGKEFKYTPQQGKSYSTMPLPEGWVLGDDGSLYTNSIPNTPYQRDNGNGWETVNPETNETIPVTAVVEEVDTSQVDENELIIEETIEVPDASIDTESITAPAAEEGHAGGENIGTNIAEGAITAMNAMAGEAESAGVGLGEAGVSGVASGAATASPSTITIEVGENIGQGLIEGMQSKVGEVTSMGNALGSAATNGVSSGMDEMSSRIEQASASIRSHMDTLRGNVEQAVSVIQRKIREIQQHVSIAWDIEVNSTSPFISSILSGNYASEGSGNFGQVGAGDVGKLNIEVSVDKDTAESNLNSLSEAATALEAIDPTIVVTTLASAALAVINSIQNAIANIEGNHVITFEAQKTGNWPSGAGGTQATGNFGPADARGTLMGELGPELVVQDGRYFVAGQNGAEFVNLQDDAIVFNHLQTEQLLKKGMSSTRGRTVTNERTAVAFAQGNINGGPAMASASAALAALKQLRSMWASLASASVQDLAGAGGGGGGGGGDKDIAAYIKELEKWYNWLQKIAELEDKINYQEQLRSTISSSQRKNGSAYYSSLKDTLKNLQEQVKTEQSLIDAQQKYFDKRRKELNTNGPFNSLYTFDENGQLKYKNGALNKLSKLNETDKYGKPKMSSEQQYDYIVNTLGIDEQYLLTTASGEKIDKEQDGWQATAVQAFWDKMDADKEEMQSLHDSINEHSEALLAAQEQQNEILQEMRDNQLAVEQNVYDAIVDSRERAIEDAEAMRDALEESTNKFIDGLSSALDKERSMYEMQQSQTDLDQKRRRLAILQRTGGSNSEIASLQSDIASSERDLYFDKQQEQIDLIQEASDKQIEKLDQQIELDKELLEYQKAHGLLWSEVADIMKMDSAAITDFITSNNSEWWAKSPVQSAQDLQDAIFQTDQWVEFRDDQNSFFQNIIDTIYNTTTNAAPDNPTSTADSTTQLDGNDDNNGNTKTEYKPIKGNDKQHKKITKTKTKKGGWKTTKTEKEDHKFDKSGVCKKCKYKKKKTDDDDGNKPTGNGSGSGGTGGNADNGDGNNGSGSNLNTATLTCIAYEYGGAQITKKVHKLRPGTYKSKDYEPSVGNKYTYVSAAPQSIQIGNNESGTIKYYYKLKVAENPSEDNTTTSTTSSTTPSTSSQSSPPSGFTPPPGYQAQPVNPDINLGSRTSSKDINLESKQGLQSLSDINLTQDELQKLRTSTLSTGLSAVNSAMKMNLAAINSSAYTTIDREKSTQIGSISLNMDVKQIANDYDAKRAGEKAMEEMLRIARKSTTATVRR